MPVFLLSSFFFSFFFFSDRLEQRDLGNYKIDLHQIFRDGIDMLMQMFNLLLVSRLVKRRCHDNQFWARNRLKSATRLPSWDSHSTMDGRIGKRMGALTAQKSCLHRIKFGELGFTDSGVYGDGLATIHARNRRNAFDS